MKTSVRFFLVILLAALTMSTIAQINNVVVFAPKGEKFTLFTGNTSHNSEPAARVETANPGGPTFKLKVVFPDASVKEITKLVFNKPHGTMFFKVEKNQKGDYTLESTTSEWMDGSTTEKNTPPSAAAAPSSPTPNENKSEQPKKGDATTSTKTSGCDNPLSEPDFNGQLVGISARPFEPMQLSAAKKMAETHCLMVSQVKMVIYVFNSESSRLSFAKYAYDHTYDRDNYSEVKDALHSEKSKTELDRYISEKSK